MAERLIVPVSKTGVPERVPRVQIPLSPLYICCMNKLSNPLYYSAEEIKEFLKKNEKTLPSLERLEKSIAKAGADRWAQRAFDYDECKCKERENRE